MGVRKERETIFNLANKLTIFRMMVVPFFILCIYHEYYRLATVLFLVAGITDALDGHIARSRNQRTTLGQLLDPLADKFLIIPAFLILTFGQISLEYRIPQWVTLLVFSRDILILLCVVFVISITGEKSFSSSFLGKATTVVQVGGVGVYLTANSFKQFQLSFTPLFLDILCYAIFAATLASGFHYLIILWTQKIQTNAKNSVKP